MILIKGNFFDGTTSNRQVSIFSVNDAEKFVIKLPDNQSGSILYSGDISQIDISPRIGNTIRNLYLKNGANFETNDNDGVDKFIAEYFRGRTSRFLHILESRLFIILLLTILVLVFMWGGVKYGIPTMAKTIAERVPAETNQYLGKEAIKILDDVVFDPSTLSVARQQKLSNLFQKYANDYPEFQINFKFRKSKGKNNKKIIGANAFTLPNGTIVFTDEMVNLAANDHELLAILGHEIGHVVHRHILRRIIQNSSISILIILITGDISSASSLVLALPSLLLNFSYSKSFEIEADDFAYDFLTKNNIDPESFAHIMQRLKLFSSKISNHNSSDSETNHEKKFPNTNENESKFIKQITPYLSTHPHTEHRIQKFINKRKDSQR